QELVRFARHVADCRQEPHRGLGRFLEEEQEVVAIELEQFGIDESERRGCARAAIEESELAENLAIARDREHDLLPGRVFDEQLDLAGADDEQRFARLAGLKERRPRRKL